MSDIKISVDGKDFACDAIEPTEGSIGIDVSRFYRDSGCLTYDPGFMSTASCKSAITFIDGDKGILRYRGYDVEDIVNSNYDFLDTAHLLIKGDFPEPSEKAIFRGRIEKHLFLDKEIENILFSFGTDSHPMPALMGGVSALAAKYNDDEVIGDEDEFVACIIAKMLMLVTSFARYRVGKEIINPSSDYSYSENFVHLMFSEKDCDKILDSLTKAMDAIFILHADHEQNASTSSVRVTASALPNPFASIVSGIATLWGPSHGGANEAVIKMLNEISSVSELPKVVERAKDKNDPFRLMGFGHRVYKSYDPRAKVLKSFSSKVLEDLGVKTPLLEIAMELEDIARRDSYFVERNLYPNVDFYSGIIFEAMGIPSEMFTPLFALARTVGWVAQRQELLNDKAFKICRPRQIFVGHGKRSI